MKPITVKIINGLIVLRYFFVIIIIALTGYVIYKSPEPGILTGFAKAIIKAANINTEITNQDESFGMVIGYLFPSIILLTLEVIFINKQKPNGFWTVLSIDIILSLLWRSIPVIAVVILFLSLHKKTKSYLKNTQIIDTQDGGTKPT